MAQNGLLVFFTETRPSDPVAAWMQALRLANVSTVLDVTRSHGPCMEWQEALASLSRPVSPIQTVEYNFDTLLRDAPIEQVPTVYIEGRRHSAYLLTTTPGMLLYEGISRDIPESIRSDFVPCDMSPTIGPHDIFEFAEHERGHFFGRAWWAVSFFSYGTPRNWKEFRRRVFDVPEVKQVKAQLEEIAGPLEQCVYWSM